MGATEVKKKVKKEYKYIPFSQRKINFEKDFEVFQRRILPNMKYHLSDNNYPTEAELKDITIKNLAKAKEEGIENAHLVILYYLCQRFVELYVIKSDYNIFNTLNILIDDLNISEEEKEILEAAKQRFQKEFPMDMKLVNFNLNAKRYRDLSFINYLGIGANLKFNKRNQPEILNLIIDDKLLENNQLSLEISDIIQNCPTLFIVNYILYPKNIDDKLEEEFALDGQTYQSLFALIKAVTVNRKIKSFVLHSMKDYNINLAPEICRLIENKLQSETLVAFHFGNFNLTGSFQKKVEFLLSSTKSLLFLSVENSNYSKESVLELKNYLLKKNRSLMILCVVTPIFNGMKKSVIEKMKQFTETENKDSKLEFIYFSHKSLIDISWLNQNI
jgi:hypothetical protein